MHGMRDFYGHPPEPKFSPWLLVPLVAAISIVATFLWADSQYAAIYKAQAMAEKQMGKTTP